jgi:hypothetical protein
MTVYALPAIVYISSRRILASWQTARGRAMRGLDWIRRLIALRVPHTVVRYRVVQHHREIHRAPIPDESTNTVTPTQCCICIVR